MALVIPDQAAYAIVRSFIAAGAAEWDSWNNNGGGAWPKTDPSIKHITATIFAYVSPMAIYIDPVDDNCPLESERVQDASCFAMTHANVFNPQNRMRMIEDLDARTPTDVRAAFGVIPEDGGDLEWWLMAIAAGTMIGIGGLPFAGATVVKIVGYLFAAWVAYKFVTPKSAGAESLAVKYSKYLGGGFDTFIAGASQLGKIALGIGALFVAYKIFAGGRR